MGVWRRRNKRTEGRRGGEKTFIASPKTKTIPQRLQFLVFCLRDQKKTNKNLM